MSSIAIPAGRTPSHRGLLVALALSIAAHVLLLTLTPRPRYDAIGPMTEREPLRVELVARAPPAEVAPPPTEPVVRPPPAPRAAPHPQAHRPPVKPSPAPPPPVLAVPQPAPVQPPEARRPAPTFDMAAMIEARRQQRHAAEEAMERRAEAPPAQDEGLASLNRNLQTLSGREGVGGIFTILHMGTRTGEFAFNGWRPESLRQWREVIEVDAGPGGNLELAMVRRMIELIRTHYTGDFNWQSHRLQRTVVLSARPEDTAELEDFLMREFFGTPTVNPRRGATRR
ncbi:MAG TPA: hypothetical protein VFP36_10920 [Usitatibacter sp.]|nr:hypothetical protein [Usitatibacter sp.]